MFIFYVLLSYVYFPFFYWEKFSSGCFRQASFHLGDKKNGHWLRMTVIVLYSNKCMGFTWADSALVVLDEWLAYRGGGLNRFDCILI